MRAVVVGGIVAAIVAAVVAVVLIGGGEGSGEQVVGETDEATRVTDDSASSGTDPALETNDASAPAGAPHDAVTSGERGTVEQETVEAGDPGQTGDGSDCPGPVPGLRIDAWVSSFSDGQVTEGEQVGETFVMVNLAWMDLPASGGATAGAFNLGWTDGSDFLSASTIFAPAYPDFVVEFDAVSGELSGEVNVGTSANGRVPVMTASPISGVLQPDGTVSGVIAHPEVDLSFDGIWSESEFRHPSDPACLPTESGG